jgi:Trypsin-co-occurring domain 1
VQTLVEFPLEGGGTVFVDVDEPDRRLDREPVRGDVTRGLGRRDIITSTGETFEAALARIQPAATAALGSLRSLQERPEEIEIEFGIRLSAEMGAIVARTAGEANFRVTLRWRSDGAEAGR